MTREMYLNVGEAFVTAECMDAKVGISTIQSLPGGGTRLVCMSVRGAETMRLRLTKNLREPGTRERRGPGWGFLARDEGLRD